MRDFWLVRVPPVLLALVVLLGAPSAAGAAAKGCGPPNPDLPHWARARSMTVLHDSVLLSGRPALIAGFPCWHVHMVGRPALMLRAAEHELRQSGRRVSPLVVIGLGYNSLWERNRSNYGRWAARFDGEAARLLRTLRRAGAEQFVWVTLRRATRATTQPSRWDELPLYAWFFPYVNDRLRTLDARRNHLVLADWARTGARPDVTYDTIHLNGRGGRIMQRLIERRIYEEAARQSAPRAVTTQADPCANRKTGAPRRAPGRPRAPFVIGDSGALLAVAPLVALGLEADARGCRPLSDALSIMAARKRAGTLPRVVALNVGANGGIDRGLLRQALRIVGKDGRLALVTPATTYAATTAMRAFHAAHPTRTILADWAATGQAERYGGDGIHIGYEGEAALARFIARHVRPYTPPHTAIPFTGDPKDCGEIHPGGKRRSVLVLRGRDRVPCSAARGLARARDKTASPYFRWFDWRFLGKPPWKDVFVRNDGKVVIAIRTPAPPPPPGTAPPAR
jgi:hypothetical protein